MKKEKFKVTESCGNVFLDLGFPPDEATILAMRSELMCQLEILIRDKQWTQAEAAQVLGISQSRVSDLICSKLEKFSLDMLITLATRAGKEVELKLAA
ncbi:MAG: XRE family transcriptional regulator [Gallionella sp.]|nr:XRE family transcriptional regulator [Gallionella sp.]